VRRRRVLLLIVSGLLAVLASSVALTAGASSAWPGCSSFATQPQAQAWWRAHGRPAAPDRDHDGVVCEDLPRGTGGGGGGQHTSCTHIRRVVKLGLSKSKYPNILADARRAIAKGWPRVLVINRKGADARRERLLRDIPTKQGFDRDEYPPAEGRGRGKGLQRGTHPTGWKADVEYVPSGENRGAGSVMGIKLRRYCNGTKFRYIGY
jgi:hypothetical protein